MEDLTINISTSEEASSRREGARSMSKKRKSFLKKMWLLKKRKGGAGPGTPQENRAVSHPSHLSSGTSLLPNSACHPKPKASPASLSAGPSSRAPAGPSTRPFTASPTVPTSRPSAAPLAGPSATLNPTRFLAMDCEMVGTGPKGSVSQLARCSIVSYDGDVVYDKFIQPPDPVTDYRTRWSGIRPRDLVKATPFTQAKKEVLWLLQGKVVIGHAVHNDFRVLGYCHPPSLTRDTSHIPLLNQKAGFALRECASLKRLTKAIFNRDIQTGRKGHSSVEDARASMELYKVVEDEWERHLASRGSAR